MERMVEKTKAKARERAKRARRVALARRRRQQKMAPWWQAPAQSRPSTMMMTMKSLLRKRPRPRERQRRWRKVTTTTTTTNEGLHFRIVQQMLQLVQPTASFYVSLLKLLLLPCSFGVAVMVGSFSLYRNSMGVSLGHKRHSWFALPAAH